MGVLSDIAIDIKAAFDGDLNDAVSAFSYTVVDDTYDAVSGKVGYSNTYSPSRGVPFGYSAYEQQDDNIQPNDVKLVVLQTELTPKPNNDDYIIGGGRVWSIENIGQDPASVTWNLQLRSGILNSGTFYQDLDFTDPTELKLSISPASRFSVSASITQTITIGTRIISVTGGFGSAPINVTDSNGVLNLGMITGNTESFVIDATTAGITGAATVSYTNNTPPIVTTGNGWSR